MDLVGTRFGRLVVLRRADKLGRPAWVCLCDCGKTTIKAQLDLRKGDSRSCGCLKRDMLKNRNTVHGGTDTPAYKKWHSMWTRVRSAHRKSNRCYVAVAVCDEWKSFDAFLRDMGAPPEGYSLDRIDNDKGYSKDNCRWVPLAAQATNTRRLRLHNGVHVSELARQAGLEPDVVFDRINKLGWDIERALSVPTRKIKRC